MTVRTPQINYFDYGKAVAAGQNIARNRMQNQAMGMDIQEQQNVIKKRQEAQQIRQQFDRMPEAINELEKAGHFAEADKLRDNYLKQAKNGIDIAQTLGRSLNKDNYKQMRQDMIQSGAINGDMWPTEYSEDWWPNTVAQKKRDVEVHTRRWSKDGVVMSQDFVTSDGYVNWEGQPFEASGDRNARKPAGGTGSGKGFTYKAADDNAIGKQATRLFGGLYDPTTGQFSGLDPSKAKKVQAVHASASELYAAGAGALTHAQAVREAAKRLRIAIEDPNDRDSTDPAGILPQGGNMTPPAAQ